MSTIKLWDLVTIKTDPEAHIYQVIGFIKAGEGTKKLIITNTEIEFHKFHQELTLVPQKTQVGFKKT